MVVVKDEEIRRKLKKVEQDFIFGDDDSILPTLFLDERTGKVSSIAYKKGGKKYFFSDVYGYTAYRWEKGKNRPRTWQTTFSEFEESCRLMRKMIDECPEDLREVYTSAIDELDYETGRDNAMFYVAPDITDSSRVGTIIFNFRNISYSLSCSNGILLKGCVDDFLCKHKEVKGLEKKLVLGVIKYSDVVADKVSDIESCKSK